MIRPIEYTVVIAAPQTQTIQIRMRVRNVASTELAVAMPAWRQGRYAILNPAGTVYNVRAENTDGAGLDIRKNDKATWCVATGGASEVVISYTVYANSLNDRTRHVDSSHAFLSGAAVFFYVPGRRGDPVSVSIDAPPAWKIASGLKHAAADPRLLLAPNYDVLIDSPIEAGLHETLCFELDGKPHDIVLWGKPRHDPEKLKRDFAAIVRQGAAIFGDLPYERYVFLLHVAPGLGGGTEHLNSTVMHVQPQAFEDDADYARLLSLAAHEMFHTWNVKQLRPEALRIPDLSKENYTDLLWFAEGATSYYDDLLVVRAGLRSPESYLASLAETIYQVRARPGSRVESVSESSFDAWIKFNQPTPNDMNATVSFYESGSLLSFLLDLEIRHRTQNRISLDTVLREMYKAFPASGPGFTTADLIATLDRLSNTRFDTFFEQYVSGTETYPFESLLQIVGLEMRTADAEPRAYAGFAVKDQDGKPVVRYVLSDGPAYPAGINAGDEILSMNGTPATAADFTKRIEQSYKPGDVLRVDLMRRGRPHHIEFPLGTKPNPRCELVRIPSPTAAQQAAYASWLGQR